MKGLILGMAGLSELIFFGMGIYFINTCPQLWFIPAICFGVWLFSNDGPKAWTPEAVRDYSKGYDKKYKQR